MTMTTKHMLSCFLLTVAVYCSSRPALAFQSTPIIRANNAPNHLQFSSRVTNTLSTTTSLNLSFSSLGNVLGRNSNNNGVVNNNERANAKSKTLSMSKFLKTSAMALVTLSVLTSPAFAAKKAVVETVEHLHT